MDVIKKKKSVNPHRVENKIIKKKINKKISNECKVKIISKKKLQKNSIKGVKKNKKIPLPVLYKIDILPIDGKKNQPDKIYEDTPTVNKPNTQLLLAYTYFMQNHHEDDDAGNVNCMLRKHISVGLDVDEFTPHVIIQTSDEKHFMKFRLLEWLSVMVQDVKIKEFFDQEHDDDKKKITCSKLQPSSNITMTLKKQTTGVIALEKKDNTAENLNLTVKEWNEIIDMNDFITSVLFHYKPASFEIKEYFNLYTARCVEQNTFNLSKSYPFLPNTEKYIFNYSRLFYELPVFCKNKIVDTVMENMLKYN